MKMQRPEAAGLLHLHFVFDFLLTYLEAAGAARRTRASACPRAGRPLYWGRTAVSLER
jgi:hypothetical protein